MNKYMYVLEAIQDNRDGKISRIVGVYTSINKIKKSMSYMTSVKYKKKSENTTMVYSDCGTPVYRIRCFSVNH